jgi:endonuclease-3
MASNNRAAQINKVLKFAKKHFKPAEIPADRTVLEHLILACCAENSLLELANEVYGALAADYYDWNEVRVTSIRELTDVMKPLNDPKEAATRLKRVLQSVFETHYSFDLEPMKKQNIGATVKQIEKYNGTTNFTVAFVTQNALAGHSIPINRGLLESLRVVGVVSDAEAAKGTVPGLERVVPKSKGTEVGTMLHQLGVELYRSPYGPTIRKFLLEIDPGCKDRLPKRPSKKVEKPVPEKPAKAQPAQAKAVATNMNTNKKAKAKTETKTAPKKPPQKTAAKKSTAKAAAPVKKKPVKKVATKAVGKKKPTKKATAVKKSAASKTKTPKTKNSKTKTSKTKSPRKGAAVKKKPPTKKTAGKAATKGQKNKSVTKKLSKRKPK